VKRTPRRIRVSAEVRAYIEKIDRYRGTSDPIRVMRAAPAGLARAVRGLSRAQLRKRPSPGKWSIEEILGHLVDTEVVYGYRYRMALAQPGMPIQAYDQAQWARVYAGRRAEPALLLEQIAVLRAINLDLVTRVPRAWWSRYGIHSERGRESVRRTLELIAGHDRNHLDQIIAIRTAFGWTAGASTGTARIRRAPRPRARRRAAA
jgi:uncharacterized damage-inducible protein DinB